MKDSFILYNENREQIKFLNTEQKAALLDAVFEYNASGTVIDMDPMTALVFSVIRGRMDRDTEKWEQTVEKRREAGRAGGLRSGESRSKCFNDEANEANASCASKNEANEAVPVPVPVPVSHKGERQSTRFAPPSPEQVRDYCQEKKINVDPDEFVDFYASKGWKVGSQPMKDWKAAVRTWSRRDSSAPPGKKYHNRYNDFPQRQYTSDEWKKIEHDWIMRDFGK